MAMALNMRLTGRGILRRSPRGQRDAHPRPAAVAVLRVGPALVRLGDPLHQREAEAQGPLLRAPVERLEDPLLLAVLEPFAPVLHLEAHLVQGTPYPEQRHPAAVLLGVVDQVRERAREQG